MRFNKQRFATFLWRVSASHMITYFVMGFMAFYLLDYQNLFETPYFLCLMKPVNSPWVALGPSMQIFRSFVISMSLWYFKDVFLTKKYGWLKLWGLLVGLSILSTVGPAPGSIEGIIYTKIPIFNQLIGYYEVLPQTLLFSLSVFYWYKYPGKTWNIVSIIFITIIVLFGIMALGLQ